MPVELIWPGALSILLAWGAVSDIKWRKLPNWLSGSLLALGLAFAFATGGFQELGWHAAHAALALIVGMALFAAGLFGGGDAKFYTGMAAFFPMSKGLDLLLYVAITGGALALFWIIMRRIAPRLLGNTKGNHGKLPYGVAIATGGIGLSWIGHIAA